MFDSSVRHRVSLTKILVPVLIVMAVLFAGATVFADAGTVSLESNRVYRTGSDASKTTFSKGDSVQAWAGFALADNSSTLTNGKWEIRIAADHLKSEPIPSKADSVNLQGVIYDSAAKEYVITYTLDSISAGRSVGVPFTFTTKKSPEDGNLDAKVQVTSTIYDGNGQQVGQQASQTYTFQTRESSCHVYVPSGEYAYEDTSNPGYFVKNPGTRNIGFNVQTVDRQYQYIQIVVHLPKDAVVDESDYWDLGNWQIDKAAHTATYTGFGSPINFQNDIVLPVKFPGAKINAKETVSADFTLHTDDGDYITETHTVSDYGILRKENRPVVDTKTKLSVEAFGETFGQNDVKAKSIINNSADCSYYISLEKIPKNSVIPNAKLTIDAPKGCYITSYDIDDGFPSQKFDLIATLTDGTQKTVASNVSKDDFKQSKIDNLPKGVKSLTFQWKESITFTTNGYKDDYGYGFGLGRLHIKFDPITEDNPVVGTYKCNAKMTSDAYTVKGEEGKTYAGLNVSGSDSLHCQLKHTLIPDQEVHYEKDNVSAFKGTTVTMEGTLHAKEAGADEYTKIKHPYFSTLLPDGLEYVPGSTKTVYSGLQANGQTVSLGEPEVIDNYKDTGRTALIWKIDQDTTVAETKKIDVIDYQIFDFTYQLKFNNLAEDGSVLETLQYGNKKNDEIDFYNESPFYDDTDVDVVPDDEGESGGSSYTTKVNYTPPSELILQERVENAAMSRFRHIYSTFSRMMAGTTNEYQFSIYNHQSRQVKHLTLLDLMPSDGDQTVSLDQGGKRQKRNSTMGVTPFLTAGTASPIQGLNPKFQAYYTTDNPKDFKDMAEFTKHAKWEVSLSDYKKMTAFKIVLKDDKTMDLNEKDTFTMPITLNEQSFKGEIDPSKDQAVDSFGAAMSQYVDSKDFIESNNVTLKPYISTVSGLVYVDKNKNGKYDKGTDTVLPNYKFKLADWKGEDPISVVTDSQGRYSADIGKYYDGDYQRCTAFLTPPSGMKSNYENIDRYNKDTHQYVSTLTDHFKMDEAEAQKTGNMHFDGNFGFVEKTDSPFSADLTGSVLGYYYFFRIQGNKAVLPQLKFGVKVEQNTNGGMEVYNDEGKKIEPTKAYETKKYDVEQDGDNYAETAYYGVGSIRFTKPGTYSLILYEPTADIQGLWQPGDLIEAISSKFNNGKPETLQTSRGIRYTWTIAEDPQTADDDQGKLERIDEKVSFVDKDQDYFDTDDDPSTTGFSNYAASELLVRDMGGFNWYNLLYDYSNQSYSGKATLKNNSQDKSKDNFKDGFFKYTITQDEKDKVQVLGDQRTKTVEAKGSDKGGSFVFDNLPIGKAGTYHFTVKEVDGHVPGYHYDTKEAHITVTAKLIVNFDEYDKGDFDKIFNYQVTTQYDGKDEPGDSLTFNNTYSDPTPASEHFTGKVTLTKDGKAQPFNGGDFTAKITEDAKDKVKAKNVPDGDVAVKSDGTLDFSNITFDQAGDYHFTVHENNGGRDNINYDNNDVDVTVHVTYDEAKGAYVAKVTYTKSGKSVDGIVFNNTVKGSKAGNANQTKPGKANNNANAQNSAKGQNAQNGAKAKSAKTGDTTNTAVWWALIGAAVCAAAGMTLARREQREN